MNDIRFTFREEETERRYNEEEKDLNFFDNVPIIKEFTFWKVIENQYPYDKVAVVHHLLCTKRAVMREEDLNELEKKELLLIKKKINKNRFYDMFIFNFPHRQTMKHRLHYHILKL